MEGDPLLGEILDRGETFIQCNPLQSEAPYRMKPLTETPYG